MALSPARRGVYSADRASALSGVPKSTIYEWAREPRPVLTPSVSSDRIKLWSWGDLVALRAIYWLRHPLTDDRRPSSMMKVKTLLDALSLETDQFGQGIANETLEISADSNGRIYLRAHEIMTISPEWMQTVARDVLGDLLSTFSVDNAIGPDLRKPRRALRIIPGKLAGEPHVLGTRIETRVLAALEHRGALTESILRMYPGLEPDELHDALELESQLERNLRQAA